MSASFTSRTTHLLVARIQDGDVAAFNPLFDRFYPRLRMLVRAHMSRRLLGRAEPDDLIQEIYIEIFRNFHKFELRDAESFWKWLVTVAQWKIRDMDKFLFETGKRVDGRAESLDAPFRGSQTSEQSLASVVPGQGAAPPAMLEHRELVRSLEHALDQLPPHYREVIRLRHFEQLSAKETGEAMGLTPNAVNVLFHRAQKRLRDLVDSIEGGAYVHKP